MVNRHWQGDVSLAILLALPFALLAHSNASVGGRNAVVAGSQLSTASTVSSNGRISLLG
jgi:hypothetical protein